MEQKSFKFWITWLKVTSWLTIAFGVFMAVNSFVLKGSPSMIDHQVNKAFFSSEEELTISMQHFQAWQYGVGAAMLCAWGLLALSLTSNALAKKERWAWNTIVGSLAIWFIIDQPISAYFQVSFNVIFNILFLLIFLAPLVFIRKYTKNGKKIS